MKSRWFGLLVFAAMAAFACGCSDDDETCDASYKGECAGSFKYISCVSGEYMATVCANGTSCHDDKGYPECR